MFRVEGRKLLHSLHSKSKRENSKLFTVDRKQEDCCSEAKTAIFTKEKGRFREEEEKDCKTLGEEMEGQLRPKKRGEREEPPTFGEGKEETATVKKRNYILATYTYLFQ